MINKIPLIVSLLTNERVSIGKNVRNSLVQLPGTGYIDNNFLFAFKHNKNMFDI